MIGKGLLCICVFALIAGDGRAQTDTQDSFPYRPQIEGVDDRDLRAVLEGSSQLFTLKDRPPATLAGLRRRAEGDLERLKVALKSEARYEGRVAYRIDSEEDPAIVTLRVDPGPAFTLRRFDIEITGEGTTDPDVSLPRSGADLQFPSGTIAKAPDILSTQARAIAQVRRQGFPFVRLRDRKVVVDLRDHVADVSLIIDAGPRARFGPVKITGLERVEPSFVKAYITWEAGALYDPQRIAAFAEQLERSGLFSAVRVRAGETLGPNGRLPVIVELVERERRTLGVGASFSTNEGPGGNIFWEHRNLSGEGEKFRTELEVAVIRQALSGRYEEPQFLQPNQTLVTTLTLESERTDAFESRSVTTGIGLERDLTRQVRAGLSAEFEYARTDDNETKTDSYLVSFPLSVTADTTDSPLDPKRGYRLAYITTPSVGHNDGKILFLKTELRASAYLGLGETKRWVLAARTRLGAISFEETEDIPAGRRFFAGGGGSIRGFAFQEVGPLDDDNDAIGGRSVIELGAEVRVRATQSFGFVPFVEGGNVFDASFPDFSGRFLWGAGLGVYYNTPVGPLRIDAAVPLNPRDGVDDPFQVYVTLGQSF